MKTAGKQLQTGESRGVWVIIFLLDTDKQRSSDTSLKSAMSSHDASQSDS